MEYSDSAKFKDDFKKLMENEKAGVIGMPSDILDYARGTDAVEASGFIQLCLDLVNKRKEMFASDPAYRFRSEREAALLLSEKEVPAFNEDELAVSLGSYYSAAADPDKFLKEIAAAVNDPHIKDLAETPASGPASKVLYASAAAGYAQGLLERAELKQHVSADEPFIFDGDRETFGWALVQAMILFHSEGMSVPAAKERVPYYAGLKSIAAGKPAPHDAELNRALAAVKKIEAMIAEGKSLGEIQAAVDIKGTINALTVFARQRDPDMMPIAVAELLKMLALYSDRDMRVFRRIKQRTLEALPSAMKAIEGAA